MSSKTLMVSPTDLNKNILSILVEIVSQYHAPQPTFSLSLFFYIFYQWRWHPSAFVQILANSKQQRLAKNASNIKSYFLYLCNHIFLLDELIKLGLNTFHETSYI